MEFGKTAMSAHSSSTSSGGGGALHLATIKPVIHSQESTHYLFGYSIFAHHVSRHTTQRARMVSTSTSLISGAADNLCVGWRSRQVPVV